MKCNNVRINVVRQAGLNASKILEEDSQKPGKKFEVGFCWWLKKLSRFALFSGVLAFLEMSLCS